MSHHRPLAAVLACSLLTAVLGVGAGPAAAAHVSPRDTGSACPRDQAGSRSDPYADVAGTTFAAEIACVSDYGVALGTGDGRYAPQATVTRAQMARFLVRLAELARLHLHDQRYDGYQDISGLDADTQRAINVIANLDIAYGVTRERFGPAEPVSRGQMASFLARFHQRVVGGRGFTAAANAFDDDNGSVHESSIDYVAGGGVTTGLGGAQDRVFAPGRLLTRGQMAGFLARILDAEVDVEVIGSVYAEPELVEGVDVGGNPGQAVIDTDGNLQYDHDDRTIHFDDNDVFLLGDREVPIEEFVAVFTRMDRLRVEYSPNVHRTSRVALVDDWVDPPTEVLATAVVGPDGRQDDVRVAWSAHGNHDGVVDRLRSTPGADGRCGTADDPAYEADGRIEEQPSSGNVLFPEEPGRAHPFVVDEDRLLGACYRYAARAVSDRVPGSTPSPAGEPSNAVRISAETDTTPPQLLRAELVREESGPGLRTIRYTFDEPFVQPALQHSGFRPTAVSLRCYQDDQPPYEEGPYEDFVFVERAEGGSIVASLTRDRIPACDTAYAKPVGVVDERGNADPERQAVPYAGMG